MSMSDLELLAKYFRQGEEVAFAEVVRRHAGMVYTVAMRVTRSRQLAEDVSQAVFLNLARDAKKLRSDTVLGAWLYSVTRRVAANTVRGENRRLIREQTACDMNSSSENSPPPAELEPLLDDAMDALAETDRTVIVLRFFENKSMADVGKELGLTTNAAQKRVSRAVEQMRVFFTRRGIATGTVAVTALLAANTAKAIPAGLVAGICASVHSTIPLTTTLIKTVAMTTLQKSLAGITVVAIASIGVAVRQNHEITQLREQLKTSRSAGHPSHSPESDTPGATPERTRSRAASAKNTGKKPTPAQLEAKLLNLAEIGIAKFGRANVYQLIAEVSEEDIPRLLPLVDAKMSEDLRERFHEAWLERWAVADAPAAFTYVMAMSRAIPGTNTLSRLPGPATDIVLSNWAQQDPAAAIKAVEALDGLNGLIKVHACHTLATAMAEKDPKGSMNWFMAAVQEDSYNYADQIHKMSRQWAEKEPAEAWKWALALPDSELKTSCMADLAQYAAKASPFEVANEITKMPPGDQQNAAAMTAAAAWSEQDPRAASAWAAQFPDPRSRGMAMEMIARRWTAQDLAATRDWIQSLPPGKDQQDAIGGMINALSSNQPAQAADAVPSLTDPQHRESATEQIGRNWFKKDPTAARQWLQKTGMPEDQIQNIQDYAEGRSMDLSFPF